MTYFYTCVGCVEQKTKCPVREVVRDAIRGQGVTSLRHRCVSRKDMFIPGQRVEVLTYSDLDFDSEYGPPPRVWFPAVIVSQFAARILVHIQPGVKDTTGEHEFCTKGNGYCKSRLGRVRSTQATDIVDMTRCDQCGASANCAIVVSYDTKEAAMFPANPQRFCKPNARRYRANSTAQILLTFQRGTLRKRNANGAVSAGNSGFPRHVTRHSAFWRVAGMF